MIDWDLVPKHMVALEACDDFSGCSFHCLDEDDGLSSAFIGGGDSISVLLSIRPSATLDIVNCLLKKIDRLEYKIHKLESAQD